MARLAERLDRSKERLSFAAAVALAALVTHFTFFARREEQPAIPDQPRLKAPPSAGAVLGAGKLYAAPDPDAYWDEGARYVFVRPAKVRIFTPIKIDVPTVKLPKLVMPLPDPGPLRVQAPGSPSKRVGHIFSLLSKNSSALHMSSGRAALPPEMPSKHPALTRTRTS